MAPSHAALGLNMVPISNTKTGLPLTLVVLSILLVATPAVSASEQAESPCTDNQEFSCTVAGGIGTYTCRDPVTQEPCGGGIWQDENGDGDFDAGTDQEFGVCIDIQ